MSKNNLSIFYNLSNRTLCYLTEKQNIYCRSSLLVLNRCIFYGYTVPGQNIRTTIRNLLNSYLRSNIISNYRIYMHANVNLMKCLFNKRSLNRGKLKANVTRT